MRGVGQVSQAIDVAQEKSGRVLTRPKAVWLICVLILLAQLNSLLTLAYLAFGSGPGSELAYSYFVQEPITWNKAYIVLNPVVWLASAIALFRLTPISVYLFFIGATLVVAHETRVMVGWVEFGSIGGSGLDNITPFGNLLKVLVIVMMTLYVLRLRRRGLLS